jgi:hypothetical protein
MVFSSDALIHLVVQQGALNDNDPIPSRNPTCDIVCEYSVVRFLLLQSVWESEVLVYGYQV